MSRARVWAEVAGGLALLIWWAPSLLLAIVSAVAFSWDVHSDGKH